MDEPSPASTPEATPMHDALALAQLAIGLSEPNPRVGCVITAPDGRVIGRGHTQQAGGPHAEIAALRDLRERGGPRHALADQRRDAVEGRLADAASLCHVGRS
jgi:pyrimidine deaminase RibD-like protein